MIDLFISRNKNGSIVIKSDFGKTTFYFCSEREAVKRYRQEHDLKYKRFNYIVIK